MAFENENSNCVSRKFITIWYFGVASNSVQNLSIRVPLIAINFLYFNIIQNNRMLGAYFLHRFNLGSIWSMLPNEYKRCNNKMYVNKLIGYEMVGCNMWLRRQNFARCSRCSSRISTISQNSPRFACIP